MIKNYKQFEGLLDNLKGPSEQDFIKDITKKKPLKTFGLFKNKDNINNLLLTSCKGGSLEGVKLAIKNGADINYWDDTALINAASNGYLDIVKYLDSLNIFDISNTYHSIFSSINSGDSIIMEYIIKNHKDILFLNDVSKEDLLLKCVEKNNINALKYLIGLGYNHHYNDDKLIRLATQMNHFEILDYLLSLGSVELYLDDYIYDIAIDKDYKEILEILKKYNML